MYGEVLWKSIKNLKFSMFIPDIYFLFIDFAVGFLLLKLTGLTALFVDPNQGLSILVNNPSFVTGLIGNKLPALAAFISNNIISVVFYLVLFVLLSFILGSSLNSMRYGMIRDVVLGEKYSFSRVINYGVRFWPIVVVRIIIFLSGIIAYLFLQGSYLILSSYLSSNLTTVIMIVLIVFAVFSLQLLFMFAFAIMFLEKKGALDSVKDSFVYFFRHKGYAFIVFLTILLVSILLIPFEVAFIPYQNLAGSITFYLVIILVARSLAVVFFRVWSQVFVFYSYKPKELPP